MSKPRLTVLMPTYNVAPYVREAIESVLAQTFTDFLLLVVDDCSTDNTLEVVSSIDDPRLRIVQNDRNVGLADNLNRGLEIIDSELFARMDGDDIALPHWLASEVAVLDAHPEVGVCGGGFERFGTVKSLVRFPKGHDAIAANMLFECTTIVPTVRTEVIRRHNLRYRTDAFPAEDYRFWADCLRVTRFANVADTLFLYRMHPTQICSSRREEQQNKVAEVRRYMLQWLSDELTDNEMDYFCMQFVNSTIDSKDDLRQRQAFANRLLELNEHNHRIEPKALESRIEKHLHLALYQTVVDTHFADGYSLPNYFRYLRSGFALRTGAKYETKFLAKSLLHKKA